MNWSKIINELENALELEGQKAGLAKILGIRSGIISDIKSGRSKTPNSNIALLLINKLNVNPKWLESGKGDIFLKRLGIEPIERQSLSVKRLGTEPTEKIPIQANIEELARQALAPDLKKINEKIEEKEKKIATYEKRISEIEKLLKKDLKQTEEVKEPAVYYGVDKSDDFEEELMTDLPLAEGLPIEACSVGDYYPVPSKFLKSGKKYCVSKINGTSMTDAGIENGCYVLLEYSNAVCDGCIAVVKHESTTTLKRLHQKDDGTWELRYEDGSGAVIPLKEGQWEVFGLFVRVL